MTEKPKRIQRKRVKGWRMPEGAASVTRPGKWGNPYKVVGTEKGWLLVNVFNGHLVGSVKETKREALERSVYYFRHAHMMNFNRADLDELRGKDLACWCKEGDPCHGDILLELANREHEPMT